MTNILKVKDWLKGKNKLSESEEKMMLLKKIVNNELEPKSKIILSKKWINENLFKRIEKENIERVAKK